MPETISPLSSVSDTYSHTRLLNNIEQLFAQARPRLLHLAHLNGVVSDYTEDVVQETLVEAWRHLETLREPARFHAWLDGICRNICRRQKRKDDTLSLHEQRIGSLFDPDATGEMDAWLDLSTSMTHPEFWESLSSPRQLICVVKPHEEGNRAVRG